MENRIKVILHHLNGISGKGDNDVNNVTKVCQYLTDELPQLKYTITNQILTTKIENNSIFHFVGTSYNNYLLMNQKNQKLDFNTINNPLIYILDVSSNNLQILECMKKKKGHVLCSIQLKKTNFILSKFLAFPLESFYEFGLKRKCNLEGHYYLRGCKKDEARKKLMNRCKKFVKIDLNLENESILEFYYSFFLFSMVTKDEYIKYSSHPIPNHIKFDEFLDQELKNVLN